MNRTKWVSCLISSVCLVALMMGSKPACAADCDHWIASAVSIQGTVQVQRVGLSTWENVKLEDRFCPGDIIRILEKSRAALVLKNEAVIRLNEKTTITIKPEEKTGPLLLKLIRGAAHFFSRVPRSLKVATPFINSTVEGTEFFVRVEESRTYFSVFRGRVRTYNDAGELLIADGQTAIATEKQAPALITVAHPRDAVSWTLYYPPIGTPDGTDIQQDLYSASEMLKTGRVTEAQDIITRILVETPNNSDALALNAIIALTLHKKEKALALAEKAVASNPKSSPAKQALAYVQQAFFDVEAARSTMQLAAADDPENALVWARLSELWLATGYLDNALSAAEKAAGLSPDISRTQTVLGYAYISLIKTGKAKEAFQKAILLDQADPLPRLGLGLALIREGDLEAGRAQIEIAASLDPGSSLVRSYLGKAFYEEKTSDLAGRHYAVAKELDPNDPTPYFYDAVRKQTINRPIEALYDLLRSIELNDNRAVYRSRLLLDQDLAARSTSLGRIFNDLGFQQLALVEGWKSINTDPANYSAHRFLSDSYAALPRHEVARVSELLQSQLLQPINITPVQPQLSESNLFILKGSGPAEPSLNEFNPLFNRNRNSLLASGVVGENGIWGDEMVFSGIWQKVSYGVGQFHYETDGFRENNDQNRDAYNLFLQTCLSTKTSIMAEGRYTEIDQGDLPLRFPFNGQDNFSLNRRKDRSEGSIRLGLRQAFSPRSQVISHFTYVDAEETDHDVFGSIPIDAFVDDTGYMVEAQHLFSKMRFKLTSGIGYFERDREKTIRFFGENITEPEVTHANFYLYSHIDYPENFTWTIGGSADLYEDDETKDRDQLNPKLGLSLTPFTGTTLRAAAFRTLKRSLAGRQTIEPTQVAGFNQFFDDFNGAKSWRYGLAIDQTISANLHGGVEYSERDIVSAFVDIRTGEIEDADWDEDLARAYIYWTPFPLLALSAEYLFEKFQREDFFTGEEQISELKTHRFPLGINFFHPSGLSANLELTYIDQKGIFGTSPEDYRSDDDQFWLCDASIRYRLPKRLGFIAVGARNLFDTDFNFQDMDLANQTIFPERTVFGKVTLSF